MSDTNGTPATWHGVPRPEGLDEALSHARGQLSADEAEDYTDEDAADFRAGPCAVCGDTTVCASQAGERLCPEHGAEDVRLGCPPQWDEDAPQWAIQGQPGPDGTDQGQAREDASVARWEARQEDAAQAVRRCAYCGHLGDLEPVNPGTGVVACVNVALCELRRLGLDPVHHLTTVARALAKDVSRLTEVELARVILALKATVRAAEVELGNNRDRARGDAALAQAAGELAPRRPTGPAESVACRSCGTLCTVDEQGTLVDPSGGDVCTERGDDLTHVRGGDDPAPAGHAMACCTSAIGPVCRHRTTPVADALQEVNYWQAQRVVISHPSGEGELPALRKLADAVRSHGIGADLPARRGD